MSSVSEKLHGATAEILNEAFSRISKRIFRDLIFTTNVRYVYIGVPCSHYIYIFLALRHTLYVAWQCYVIYDCTTHFASQFSVTSFWNMSCFNILIVCWKLHVHACVAKFYIVLRWNTDVTVAHWRICGTSPAKLIYLNHYMAQRYFSAGKLRFDAMFSA